LFSFVPLVTFVLKKYKKLKINMLRTFFLCLFCAAVAKAQIAPPILRCVKQDTLLWTPPNNACGNFVSHLIYYSRNIDGPYAILSVINNPTQNRYFFNNVLGGAWYFYMESNYNCPGQTRRPSDTVTNFPPSITPISAVSVLTGNQVEIRWRRNTSPQVAGYIIYRNTNIGWIPIDTVRSRDSVHYIDSRASPLTKSESYQILAMDACGTTSLFDVPHNTIFLQGTQQKCEQSVQLKWQLYKNGSNPIERHEIWLSVNGRLPYLYRSIGATDTTFTYTGVNNGERLVFSVKAVQNFTNLTVKSNDFSLTAAVIQPVKQLFLKNINVTKNNNVELIWYWNSDAKVDTMRIWRDGALTFRRKQARPLDDDGTFTDTSVNASKKSYTYKVQSQDECNTLKMSNSVTTILLSGGPLPQSRNKLTWTPFNLEGGRLTGYQVYRTAHGITTAVGGVLTTDNLEFEDLAKPDESEVCYLVAAQYEYRTPDGTTEQAASKSNGVCISQYVHVFIPNAFTPAGKNPEFKPLVSYEDNILTYHLSIFDRWGHRLFETSNVTMGWDGSGLPQGIYTYFIQLTQRNGSPVDEKGTFLLLR
jgi:CHU_C Type IX secretion signal domain